LYGKGALVVEPKVDCDFADRHIGLHQQVAGFLNSQFDEILLWGKVEIPAKASFELTK
jgi:hypothetical protein